MKYTIETNGHKCRETLETEDGLILTKFSIKECGVFKILDREFCEQLESMGFDDVNKLEQIYDTLDNSFFADDVNNIGTLIIGGNHERK